MTLRATSGFNPSAGGLPITGTTITATTGLVVGTNATPSITMQATGGGVFSLNSGTFGVSAVNQVTMLMGGSGVGFITGSDFNLLKPLGYSSGANTASDLYLSRYAAKQLLISGDGTGATTNAGVIVGYSGTSGAAIVKPSASSVMYLTSAPNTQTGATYTVTDTDNWIIANRAGTITLTLPTASSYTGRAITVSTITANTVVSNASNVVPQAGGAAGTAILAATAGKWANLVSDGTNWQIMQSN